MVNKYSATKKMSKAGLARFIAEHFDEADLAELCMEAEKWLQETSHSERLNPDMLSGSGVREKAFALVEYLDRRGLLDRLDEAVRRKRRYLYARFQEQEQARASFSSPREGDRRFSLSTPHEYPRKEGGFSDPRHELYAVAQEVLQQVITKAGPELLSPQIVQLPEQVRRVKKCVDLLDAVEEGRREVHRLLRKIRSAQRELRTFARDRYTEQDLVEMREELLNERVNPLLERFQYCVESFHPLHGELGEGYQQMAPHVQALEELIQHIGEAAQKVAEAMQRIAATQVDDDVADAVRQSRVQVQQLQRVAEEAYPLFNEIVRPLRGRIKELINGLMVLCDNLASSRVISGAVERPVSAEPYSVVNREWKPEALRVQWSKRNLVVYNQPRALD